MKMFKYLNILLLFSLCIDSLFADDKYGTSYRRGASNQSGLQALMAQYLANILQEAQKTATNTEISSNIQAFDSNFTGGYAMQNTGGIHHDDANTPYWSHAFIINETTFPFANQPSTQSVHPAAQLNTTLFKLQQNINFKPTQSYIDNDSNAYNGIFAAIIIDRDNVTIDLSGFSLSFDGSLLSESINITGPTEDGITVHGVYIAPGRSNIQIISNAGVGPVNSGLGAIQGFPGYAIVAGSSAGPAAYVENITCKNIILSRNYNGVQLNKIVHTVFDTVYINKNICGSDFYGIYGNMTDNVSLTNVTTDTNLSYANVYGLYFTDSENINLSEYTCTLNSTDHGVLTGITLYTCNNVTLEKGNINANSASSSIKGIYSYNNSFNNRIFNTEINNNSSSLFGSAIGIEINNSFAHIISSCTINENQCADNESALGIGILINNSSFKNSIKDNTLINNKSNTNSLNLIPTSYGIRLEDANFNEIINNYVGNHESYGFIDVADANNTKYPSSNIYHKNYAFYNVTKAANDPNNTNKNNYFIWQQVTNDENIASLEPLATTIIYAGDSSPYNTSHTLDNIEVKKINTNA
ncbi:hypothetical protein EBR77_00440 [bacterium]|nr:hypothetical protein [bacterium]